jgi:hypothetical protein
MPAQPPCHAILKQSRRAHIILPCLLWGKIAGVEPYMLGPATLPPSAPSAPPPTPSTRGAPPARRPGGARQPIRAPGAGEGLRHSLSANHRRPGTGHKVDAAPHRAARPRPPACGQCARSPWPATHHTHQAPTHLLHARCCQQPLAATEPVRFLCA